MEKNNMKSAIPSNHRSLEWITLKIVLLNDLPVGSALEV
ncbi:unnamed protein product, partial [marine sediment metagenome]